MINEEVARKTLNMEVRAGKVTGKILLNLLKKLMKEADKLGGLEKLVNTKLYKVMNDVERRQLIEALISEIQIYEEKQANGQWLKSIIFKLPIIDEELSISLDNDEQG